ncbi:DUF1795 domain-containing protein [Paracoccus fistulariae]|uniref:DUF1795 domain-containing protein n=1 Tax=Paracoccus fistulariae TaxID=658446 RepID=A0ABY7SFU4_9RHOB|nr:DUF1795 domain-containing protein [Paracoccus fistulariae]MDB6182696.1 DUF1795 domain-containing protein [Paracoccus fistulariae]WCR05739.1 DUF1795 domain-containing protein [Paracoccus fistulariae]
MYRINEGLIDIPDDWQDRSVNVIGSTITGAGVTMTITRDEIPMGMPFAEYVQGQARQARDALDGFVSAGPRDLLIDGRSAIEIECRWNAKQGRVHQIITTVQYGHRALVLTASVAGEMSDARLTEMRRIISSLQFEENNSNGMAQQG